MTKKSKVSEILPQLKAWEDRVTEFDLHVDKFYVLTGATVEAPMMDAIHKLEDAYTLLLAESIGDTNGWLMWWRWECDMGRKPLGAQSGMGPLREVRTLKQLARLIVG